MALRAAGQAKRKAQENWRQRDREVRNIAQVNVRVPVGLLDAFKRFGELLRDSKKPSEAFAGAFPKDYAALLRAAQQRKQEQVWRRAKRNTARSVRAVAIAGAEKAGCPPRVLRGAALHAAIASSENQQRDGKGCGQDSSGNAVDGSVPRAREPDWRLARTRTPMMASGERRTTGRT